MRPRASGLIVQHPVHVSYGFRIENTVLPFEGVAFGKVVPDEGRVDRTINDGMGHMDALWPQLPRHGLGKSAQGEFGTRER